MQEMSRSEIEQAIEGTEVAVLGLARDDRAYAIPLFFEYEDGVFYWHSQPGTKDSYIHETEEACLTMLHGTGQDDWESVMAFGKAQPVWDEVEVEEVDAILSEIPPPPEVGEEDPGEPKRSGKNAVYWKLEPDRLTGRESHT